MAKTGSKYQDPLRYRELIPHQTFDLRYHDPLTIKPPEIKYHDPLKAKVKELPYHEYKAPDVDPLVSKPLHDPISVPTVDPLSTAALVVVSEETGASSNGPIKTKKVNRTYRARIREEEPVIFSPPPSMLGGTRGSTSHTHVEEEAPKVVVDPEKSYKSLNF